MTLQQLRYVTAVADTGTISRAAQQFYISQPSLTNAIPALVSEDLFNKVQEKLAKNKKAPARLNE